MYIQHQSNNLGPFRKKNHLERDTETNDGGVIVTSPTAKLRNVGYRCV